MSGKRSTQVVLERQVREEQPSSTETNEEVSLEEIFRLIGYPKSWAEMTRESLAAQGKTWHWKRVDDRWETEI